MSPLIPCLLKDSEGSWRLHLSPYAMPAFKADDLRFQQGREFPKDMLKIADPTAKLSDEDAISALDAAIRYYSPKRK